jgi:heme/copper-type cytochrome/quinol oxidase subunit 2
VAGLFLLEIGWTLILVMATKLTGEEQGAPKGPPKIGETPLTTWWIIGGAVIFLWWGLYSCIS